MPLRDLDEWFSDLRLSPPHPPSPAPPRSSSHSHSHSRSRDDASLVSSKGSRRPSTRARDADSADLVCRMKMVRRRTHTRTRSPAPFLPPPPPTPLTHRNEDFHSWYKFHARRVLLRGPDHRPRESLAVAAMWGLSRRDGDGDGDGALGWYRDGSGEREREWHGRSRGHRRRWSEFLRDVERECFGSGMWDGEDGRESEREREERDAAADAAEVKARQQQQQQHREAVGRKHRRVLHLGPYRTRLLEDEVASRQEEKTRKRERLALEQSVAQQSAKQSAKKEKEASERDLQIVRWNRRSFEEYKRRADRAERERRARERARAGAW